MISDPLAFWLPGPGSSAPGGGRPDTARYDRAARALEEVRREIEAVLAVRQDAEQRLVQLRDVLSRADRTLTEARSARGEVLAKIAASEVPAVSGPATVLQERLAAASSTAGTPSGTGCPRSWRRWSERPRRNCCGPASR